MVRIFIVEDELHCLDSLEKLLLPYQNQIRLLGSAQTVDDGILLINELKPDLLFLDVQLGNNTGFDLLNAFDKLPFSVIFTTAYEKFAIRAFKYSALDYLLKPIYKADFDSAMGRYLSKVDVDSIDKRLNLLLDNLKLKELEPKNIAVPTLQGFHMLNPDDIAYCEADINYTTIFYEKSKLTVSKTLKHFEEILNTNNFYRVHQSYLVNLAHVAKYFKGKGGYLLMNDGKTIKISQRKKEDFLKRLKGS